MSTENQQYSIENQMAAIAEYAKSHDFEIVRTYSDQARSGIDLARRPGLRQLLDDITNSKADFRAVLVYDISRWGRFQDADESACYEFLCRRAGVNVLYCAEPFANDISVATALFKTLKRTMAGEYLRELSTKVFAGQCRVVRKGYKPGGPAGYGLRRLLLSPEGKPKMLLQRGEWKHLTTERVTYVLGPAKELRIVRKIYSLFLDSGLKCHTIARWLNGQSIPGVVGGKWSGQMVHKILSHGKYTGCIVFNQVSGRLRSKAKRNPRDQWITQPNSFPAIISQKRFDLAQDALSRRVHLRSDEQLLEDLREFVKKHGKATQVMLATDPNMARGCTYGIRFGSFRRALELIRVEPAAGFGKIERRARIKNWLQDEFARIMAEKNLPAHRSWGVFLSPAFPPVVLDVARCFLLSDGQLRWEIRPPIASYDSLRCITLRLQADDKLPLDYVYIPSLPPAVQRIRFSSKRIHELGLVVNSLSEAIEQMLLHENAAIPKR
jgi:DNA invertase Pin-like site-specific DNA recombinase